MNYDLDYISKSSCEFLMLSFNNLKTLIQQYLFRQNLKFPCDGNYDKVDY